MLTRIYDCYYSSINVTCRAYVNTHLRLLLKQHRRHMSRLCQHASTVVTKATSTSHVALMSTRIYDCYYSSIDVTGRAYVVWFR